MWREEGRLEEQHIVSFHLCLICPRQYLEKLETQKHQKVQKKHTKKQKNPPIKACSLTKGPGKEQFSRAESFWNITGLLQIPQKKWLYICLCHDFLLQQVVTRCLKHFAWAVSEKAPSEESQKMCLRTIFSVGKQENIPLIMSHQSWVAHWAPASLLDCTCMNSKQVHKTRYLGL